MREKLITILVAIGLIGFVVVGINNVRHSNQKIQLNEIELKSRETELIELNTKYDQVIQLKTKTEKEKQDQLKQIKQLQKDRERLEAELQAKLNRQAEEKEKLARASEKALQTVTHTQTAYASTNGNIESIIRSAATKHGLNPDWFVRLAQCESGLNPNIVNYNYYDNGHPSGLFQHISGYYPARAAKYGYSSNVFDAYSNANVTAAMFRDGLQGLWECK